MGMKQKIKVDMLWYPITFLLRLNQVMYRLELVQLVLKRSSLLALAPLSGQSKRYARKKAFTSLIVEVPLVFHQPLIGKTRYNETSAATAWFWCGHGKQHSLRQFN